MNWLFEGKEVLSIPKPYIGFVYLITNLSTGQKYIGKKNFYCTGYKQVNKKRKRVKKESNWKSYYGSSDWLKEDVAELGEDNFKREILRMCKKKGELSYFEAKYQFEYDVLTAKLPDGSPAFYNLWIDITIRASHMQGVKM